VSQPFDRSSRHKARGDLDVARGEFWVENTFQMPSQRHNLSAFEQNRVYLNQDGQRFLEVSHASRANIDSDSRSAIIADFDGDLAPDVLVGSVGGGPLRLFKNQFPVSGQRIRLNLIGHDSNRHGIGARVTLQCGQRQIVRDLFPADGFMGQSPTNFIIGTGQVDSVDRLIVRWSSGLTQQFDGVPVGHVVTIEESNDQLKVAPF